MVHRAVLDSTNRFGCEGVADGSLTSGAVIVADVQTAGRGRRGRAWITVPGRSLAASFVIRPPDLARPARLALIAGVAAARALESLGSPDLSLKWPNDLMRDQRKLGGLLIEAARPPSGEPLQVLGFGLNLALSPGDLPPALQATVTDAGLPPRDGDGPSLRDVVLSALATELDRALAAVGTPHDAELGEEYRRRSWLTGRRVRLIDAGTLCTGVVEDVTRDGDLILDGRLILAETAGEVRPAE